MFLDELSYSEKLMLGYYATQNTDSILPSEIAGRISRFVPDFKLLTTHTDLAEHGFLVRGSYSFTFRELMYRIPARYLVKVLEWLYDTDEGNSVLKVLQKVFKRHQMDQKPVQMALCDYIRSGYKDTSSVMMIFGSDVEYLLPIVNDNKYIALMSHISEVCFVEIVNIITKKCHSGELQIDSHRLISLAETRKFTTDYRRDEVLAALGLYSYLAEGEKPRHVSDKPLVDAYIIQAVTMAYDGKYSAAIKMLRKAQVLNNTRNARPTGNMNLPYSIVNFLFIICCKLEGGSMGEDLIRQFLKRNEKDRESAACVAWALAAALTNKRGYLNDMRVLSSNCDPMSKQLFVVLVQFLGRNNILTDEAFVKYAPSWLTLKKGDNTIYSLLHRIHVKQQWEYVIEALSGNVQSAAKNDKTERIAYFIRDIYDEGCEVRQQSVLKGGGWGAGKAISYATFMGLDDDILTPSDRRIRDKEKYGSKHSTYYISLATILPEMVKESRLYVGRWAPYTLMNVNEEMPYLVIEDSGDSFSIKSNVPEDKVEEDVIVTARSASDINFIRMTPELRPYFSQLLDLGKFPAEARDTLIAFLESLRGKVEVHSSLLPGGSTLDTVQGASAVTIQMRPQGKDAYVVSVFVRPLASGNVQCVPGEGSSVIVDTDYENGTAIRRVRVERSLDRERELYYDLVNGVEDGLPPEKIFQVDAYGLLPIIDFVSQHEKQHPGNYLMEWPEGQRLNIHHRYTASQWQATLKKNKNGWFEMEGNVQLDENTKISVSQLLDLVGKGRNRFIQLGEGEYLALSARLQKQLSALDAIAARSRGHLQMSAFSAALLDSQLTNGELQIDVDPELKAVRQRILDASEYKPEVPKVLNATLRPYQLEGYQWIARLNSWGSGALLADDMGLGKTIQTISYLLLKAEEGPALVVAPASVAPNWLTEIEKFWSEAKDKVTILNFAPNRSQCIAEAKAGEIVITTYGLLLSVKEEITQKEWTTVVLDEAHVIKNRGAKTSAVAMKLKSKYRIMLTGTPVQNHLGELWNLFQFVNPGLLGSYEDFGRRFITPIEVGKDTERQKQLDKIVHPFMLRRTKEKVLSELPEKTEIYQTVDLSQEELAVYELIREKAEQMLMDEAADKVSVNTLAEITRLRQAACSAQLVEKGWKGKCSKIEALVEALEPIVESGDAALVFSQFTSFLTLVQKALKKSGIPYLYIDGSVAVKERQRLVESFQKGEYPVFIISLKAGGLGLNLTRANYVFHLDPWWNPAIEQQATDRAHRIGQHNAVTVYHLLSSGTIEEKIKRMHETKRNLADNVLEGTDLSGKLTGKELLEMIR